MFDGIEQPLLVPLYPATRQSRAPPESAANTPRRPPTAVGIHANAPRSVSPRVPQPGYATDINSQGSRYPHPTSASGGVTPGLGVSLCTASRPRPSAFVPQTEQSNARSRSVAQSLSTGAKGWWANGDGNGGGTTARGSGPKPSVHRAPPDPNFSMLASRTTIFSEARRQRFGSGVNSRKAWNRAPEESHLVVAGKATGGTGAGATPAYGGLPYGSRQPPPLWRSGDGSMPSSASGADVEEATRRGDERSVAPWEGSAGTWK